jgi:hypothetical protein
MRRLHDELAALSEAIVSGGGIEGGERFLELRVPANVGLEIYRNNFRGNLQDVLTHLYPVVRKLVGESFFRRMASSFIDAYPSTSGNLHDYGRQMPGFLAEFGPARALAYLPEVAELEWHCHCAYLAEDVGVLDLGKLALVPQDRQGDLLFRWNPAASLMRSRFSCASIWLAHQPGSPEDFHLELTGNDGTVLIARVRDEVEVHELSPAEGEWLSCLQSRRSLSDATFKVLEIHPQFNLQSALMKAVSLEVLVDVSLREEP